MRGLNVQCPKPRQEFRRQKKEDVSTVKPAEVVRRGGSVQGPLTSRGSSSKVGATVTLQEERSRETSREISVDSLCLAVQGREQHQAYLLRAGFFR